MPRQDDSIPEEAVGFFAVIQPRVSYHTGYLWYSYTATAEMAVGQRQPTDPVPELVLRGMVDDLIAYCSLYWRDSDGAMRWRIITGITKAASAIAYLKDSKFFLIIQEEATTRLEALSVNGIREARDLIEARSDVREIEAIVAQMRTRGRS